MPSRRRRSLPLALAAAAVLAAPAAAHAAEPFAVDDGIVYGHGAVGAPVAATTPLLMDLYRPAAPAGGNRPVVVLVHGGGFAIGNRKDPHIVRIAGALAERGVAVATIDYRLLDQQPVPSSRVAPLVAALPRLPISSAVAAAADDTLTAIHYLRAHAGALGIDRRRIGLVGSSAGAITVDQVGYALDDHGIRRPPLRFVAGLWGGILVAPPRGHGTAGAVQLEHGEPPLFAVHGSADQTLPVSLDDTLVARAQGQGVPSEYHRIPGGTHGYDGTQFFTYRLPSGATPFQRLLHFATDALRRRGGAAAAHGARRGRSPLAAALHRHHRRRR